MKMRSMVLAMTMSLTSTLMSSIAFGQERNLTPQNGEVVCPVSSTTGQELGYCTYTLVHLTRAQELIRKIEQTLFKGDPLTSPEGMMEALGNNNKVLTFWHTNKETLNVMKEVIPFLDNKETFTPNTIVEFKADVYEISETGLSNLGAEITNLTAGYNTTSTVTDNSVSIGGNGLGLDLKLGIVQLSGLLSAEKQKGNLRKKLTIVRPVSNLGSIEYDDVTNIYQAPGQGTSIKDEYTGITLDGTVSVNALDPSLVNIKNFKITYGYKNSDETVNLVTLPYETLTLQEGISFPLVSSKSVGTFKTTSTRILGISRKVVNEDAKLLIYVSVKVRSWREYISSIRGLLSVGKERFSKNEIQNFSNNCVSNIDLLNDIIPVATRDHQGDPVLSIKLNKANACLNNIKNRVTLTITGEGISKKENKKISTVESLMHIPSKITIALKKLREPLLNFRVKLEMTVRGKKTKVIKKLKFANSSYSIEDNFWVE